MLQFVASYQRLPRNSSHPIICLHAFNNEKQPCVRELGDEILKKIAHELTESLRQNLSVDWSERESVRAKLRLMVKRILRKYKYPPDLQDAAVELVLQQAHALGEEWA
jgi:type I restriction enzyme R subunit